MFAGVLNDEDARRATVVIEAVLAHGIRCALTGGLAIDIRLRRLGRPGERRSLNDIDLVVENFAAIPESLSSAFLQHHVHPHAIDGRTLLQLVDQPRAIRIDLFCALGGSLSRASKLTHDIGDLDVLSVEDLLTRTTAFVCGRLRRGETIDGKHAVVFTVPGTSGMASTARRLAAFLVSAGRACIVSSTRSTPSQSSKI